LIITGFAREGVEGTRFVSDFSQTDAVSGLRFADPPHRACFSARASSGSDDDARCGWWSLTRVLADDEDDGDALAAYRVHSEPKSLGPDRRPCERATIGAEGGRAKRVLVIENDVRPRREPRPRLDGFGPVRTLNLPSASARARCGLGTLVLADTLLGALA
jgi:hypothetical protein